MTTYLDKIIEATRRRVEVSQRARPLQDLAAEIGAGGSTQVRDLAASLAEPGISLIAEIKRASPSAGDIHTDIDPAGLAARYGSAGARAISVLTEPEFFKGSLEDLVAAKAACSVPVLRKDFIVDEYQVTEAAAAGADAILLIVAALTDSELKGFSSLAESYGLGVLIEVHAQDELDRALALDPQLLGVNQRDLRTFEVDTGLASRLRKIIPGRVVVVAESGIKTRDDVQRLREASVDAILVGEALMRSADPAAAAVSLMQVDG